MDSKSGLLVMKAKRDTYSCPLCSGERVEQYFEDKKRIYLQCCDCRLVYVPKFCWLSVEEEKSIYDLHENNPEDPGYRKFLSRLSVPLLERLDFGKQGLDFGCGPGPTLSVLLAEGGQQVDLYDPFYYSNSAVFDKTYDFICATEVVEHLREPGKEFSTLFVLLKPGGWLGIMTKMVIDQSAFSRWHYIQDLTHICFYSESTFEYIAERFGAEMEIVTKDVILLKNK